MGQRPALRDSFLIFPDLFTSAEIAVLLRQEVARLARLASNWHCSMCRKQYSAAFRNRASVRQSAPEAD
jgi:hypothetical protein